MICLWSPTGGLWSRILILVLLDPEAPFFLSTACPRCLEFFGMALKDINCPLLCSRLLSNLLEEMLSLELLRLNRIQRSWRKSRKDKGTHLKEVPGGCQFKSGKI